MVEMMKRIYIFLLVISYDILLSDSKTFTRCGLVKELLEQGFPKSQLRNWVCLIEAASKRRMHHMSAYDDNGFRRYGIFQINDQCWCSNSDSPGKICHLRCKDVVESMKLASECAKKIHSIQGFKAWTIWRSKCRGQSLPDINDCDNQFMDEDDEEDKEEEEPCMCGEPWEMPTSSSQDPRGHTTEDGSSLRYIH